MQEGLEWFEYYGSENFNEIYNNIRVLPIVSDPTSKDGDKDGILDIKDGQKLIKNNFPDLFIGYINDDKIKFSDIIISNNIYICSVPITKLGLIIKTDVFGYYDEYGDYCNLDEEQQLNIANGYFDNWYIMCNYNNGDFQYNCIYTQEIDKLKSSITQNDISKGFNKLIDKIKLPVKTIKESYKENGFSQTTKEVLQGAASATVENMYMLMGNFGDLVDSVKSFIGNTSSNTDSDIFNNLDFGSNKHTTSYSDDAKRKYIEFEQQHFNTNNQTYQAAKCLTYDFNMIEDLEVAITGATISVNGVKLFLTGGAAVITAPETGGTSLIIAIPEIIGGLAITAEGAAVCHVGTVTIASNMDSYNKTIQCLKENSMFGGSVTVKYNGKDVSVYRGGNDFIVKPDEVRVDPETGLLKDTHGVSLDVNKDSMSKFGGAYKIDFLPKGLKIIQRGIRLEHFEIVPSRPMTFKEYQDLLNLIRTSKS